MIKIKIKSSDTKTSKHSHKNEIQVHPQKVRPGNWSALLLVMTVLSGLFLNLSGPIARAASGTIYYVSPAGSDKNSGTSPERAWQSLAKATNFTFQPGDQLLLQGGTRFRGSLTFEAASSGTSGVPLTVGSFGRGRATIEAGSGPGIVFHNLSNLVLKDLVVSGNWNSLTQSGSTANGIEIKTDLSGGVKLKSINLNNLEVSGFKRSGLYVGATPPDKSKSGFEDVRVTNLVSHDNGDAGINFTGTFDYSSSYYSHKNVYVGYSRAYNNYGIVNKGAGSGNGILLSDVDGGLIERSVAYNNGKLNNNMPAGPAGIWAWDSNNIVIQYNEAYDTKSGTIDGNGFGLDGGTTNSVMQYNYSHNNQSAGYGLFQYKGARPHYNNTARYNLSQNDASGINMWDGNGDLGNWDVYNNVVYTTGAAVKAISPLNLVRFTNNIFLATDGGTMIDVVSGQGFIFQNNNYWNGNSPVVINWMGLTYNGLAEWQRASGQEIHDTHSTGLNLDPQLVAPGTGATLNDANLLNTLTGYQLQPGSPMLNQGLNLAASIYNLNPGSQDFYGNTLPQDSLQNLGLDQSNRVGNLIPAPKGCVESGCGPNLVNNGSFEADGSSSGIGSGGGMLSPQGWQVWAANNALEANFTESNGDGGGHSGNFHATHWKNTAYEVYTYQTITGLRNGTYSLKAWVRSSGGQASTLLEAKSFGGSTLKALIRASAEWTPITISPIEVTNGQLTIGFYSKANANQWLHFDDVEVTPYTP